MAAAKQRSRGAGRRSATLVLAALLAASAAPASAHTGLVQATPQAEAVAERSPRELVLRFNQRVVARGAAVRLTRTGGSEVRLGRVQGRDGRTLALLVRARLAPGVYVVRWSVLGGDGHPVTGRFGFGVAGADGTDPPGVDQLGAPGTASGDAESADAVVSVARWAGIVSAGFVLAIGIVAGATLRRRRIVVVAAGGLVLSAWYLLVEAARGLDGALSAALLVSHPGGVWAIVRATLALGFAVLLARHGPSRALSARLSGLLGAAVLVTFALDGHVQGEGSSALLAVALVVHVLAAGLWTGGLALFACGLEGERRLRVFAPLAAASVALLAVTGVLTAVREVETWHFLWWTDYGRVVVAKALLLLLIVPLAAGAAWSLRKGAVRRPVLRVEAAALLSAVALAAVLAGLSPGRGQPLPAERGNLLLGAAYAASTDAGGAWRVVLAPARPGGNVLSVARETTSGVKSGRKAPRTLRVTLRCTCASRPIRAVLRRRGEDRWAAKLDVPARGTFRATLASEVAGSARALTLVVGDAPVPGAAPRDVLMTADLTGRAAQRCRAQTQGAVLALGRFNALGGLPDGQKVALRVVDDGGSRSRAVALVARAKRSGTIALLAPCGDAAAAATAAARGMPTISADPGAGVVARPLLWRIAGNPEAEGQAIARFVLERRALAPAAPRRAPVTSVIAGPPSPAARGRTRSMTRALAEAGVRVRRGSVRALPGAVSATASAAVVVDGDPDRIAAALREVTGERAVPVIAASPLLDERFQRRSGAISGLGALISPSEVAPRSVAGARYERQLSALFPGDAPTIAGLRGYVAGLTLAEGLRDGVGSERIEGRLRRPRPFTDALVAPWSAEAPALGGRYFQFLSARQLSAALVPPSGHGNGYFPNGTWIAASPQVFGPR